MEKQTKILIGLAVLGAAAYFIFRPKADAKVSMPLGDIPNVTVKCKDGTTDVANGVVVPCQGVHGGVVSIVNPEIRSQVNLTPEQIAAAKTAVDLFNPKTCPEGYEMQTVPCLMAPCPNMCLPK